MTASATVCRRPGGLVPGMGSRRRRGSGASGVRALLGLVTVLVGGCAVAPFGGGDGPPHGDEPRLAAGALKNAVPRVEPRSRYGNPPSYEVNGRRYRTLASAAGYRERGLASWYGRKFHGRRTSSGEPYDMYAMTAAHRSLPLPSYVRVTHLGTGRSVVVRVNDRGPFHPGRIIDLSWAAALKLGITGSGTAPVEVEALVPGAAGRGPAAAVPAASSPARHRPETTGARGDRPGRMYLQAGAFATRANAERLADRLRRMAGDRVIVRTVGESGRRLHKVWLGPFTSTREMDRLAGALVRGGIRELQVLYD